MGLKREDTPARSWTALSQALLVGREEEETALERAEVLLVAIRGLKYGEDNDKRGNREEEVKRKC